MSKAIFISELEKFNIKLSELQLQQFDIYQQMLIDYNKKFNLTAIVEEDEIYLKHFLDSAITFINHDIPHSLCDIGAGAGFPSMVLKILYPQIKLTIIESNQKKIFFLSELAKALNLTNITLVGQRVEDYAKQHREVFDIVVARAVANLRILSELAVALIKKDGYLVALKAKSYLEEIEVAEKTLKILNLIVESIEKIDLLGMERNIIWILKTKKTDLKYPRSYSRIKNHNL